MGAKATKQGPTAEETRLKEKAIFDWQDYETRFIPAEHALAKKAEFTSGERAQVKGEASADTAAAFKGLARDTVAKGGAAGADANSGKTKFSLASDADAAGQAKGLSQAAAVTGAEMDSTNQKMGLAAQGRNVSAGVTANLSGEARRATNLQLAVAESKFVRNQARTAGLSAVAGAAAAKVKNAFDFSPELHEIAVTSQKRGSFSNTNVSHDPNALTQYAGPLV